MDGNPLPTRGERLNNPGNIDRTAAAWRGMADDQSGDARFVVFSTPEHGIRALCKVLMTYYRRHGLNTVRTIINRWAPPGENDSVAYIDHVARILGVSYDDPIQVDDADTLELLARAIIQHENGRVIYEKAVIVAGVDMALGRFRS